MAWLAVLLLLETKVEQQQVRMRRSSASRQRSTGCLLRRCRQQHHQQEPTGGCSIAVLESALIKAGVSRFYLPSAFIQAHMRASLVMRESTQGAP